MSDDFDPYMKWLGIPPEEQPPNHYRLLGIPLFVDDLDVVETGADRQMMLLRSLQAGQKSKLSQKLLNEVSAAKICLLNSETKSTYDAELKNSLASEVKPKPKAAARKRETMGQQDPAAAFSFEPTAKSGSSPARTVPRVASRPARQHPAVIGSVLGGIVLLGAVITYVATREDSSSLATGPDEGRPRPPVGEEIPNGSVSKIEPRPEQTQPPVDKPPVHILPIEKPPVTTVAAGQSIDLLKQIDPQRDAIDGEWEFQNDVLIAPVGDHARLQIPISPPSQYKIVAVVERREGDGSFRLGLLGGGRQFYATLDGFQGNSSFLDDLDGLKGGPNREAVGPGGILQDGKPTTIECTVTKLGIRVVCDGTAVIDWMGDFDRLALPPSWGVPSKEALVLGGNGSSYRVHKLTITSFESESPPVVAGGANSVDLLKQVEAEKPFKMNGMWTLENGVLASPDEKGARLQIPYVPPAEYDLRFIAERKRGNNALVVGLIGAGRQFFAAIDGTESTTTGLALLDGKMSGDDDNESTRKTSVFTNDTPTIIVVSVRKAGVRIVCDRKVIVDWSGDYSRLTLGDFWRVPRTDCLFIGSYETVYHIREMSIIPYEGDAGPQEKSPPVATVPPVASGVKLPVPNNEAIGEAQLKIKELFGSDVGKATTTAAKLDLAKSFIKQADNATIDASARYVLLRLAGTMAVEAGDAEVTLQTVDALAEVFDVEIWTMRIAALKSVGKSAKGAGFREINAKLATVALAQIDRALESNNYDAAIELGAIAVATARSSRFSSAQIKKIVAHNKEVETLAQIFPQVREALTLLESQPDDPDANLVAGRFFCLSKGEWQRGLPLLAKGADADTKEAAAKDIGKPTEAKNRVALADAWWSMASREDEPAAKYLQLRAGYWYGEARFELKGVERLRVEKRIEQITRKYADFVPKINHQKYQVKTTFGAPAYNLTVAFSPDGKTLATNGKLWDIASGELITTLSGNRPCAFSPNGKLLGLGAPGGLAFVWEIATGKQNVALQGKGIVTLAFSPDGSLIVTADNSQVATLWGAASGKVVGPLRGHKTVVRCAVFSPNGKYVASSSYDATVKLWDTTSRQLLKNFAGHASNVATVRFSPDGRLLASGSDDRFVKIWDIASGQEMASLTGHSESIHSVAFSPDGRTLATGFKELKLWDVASGREIVTIKDHPGRIYSLAFSPNGKLLAASGDGRATVLQFGTK